MSDILKKIWATKYEEVAAASKLIPLHEIRAQAEGNTDLRDFAGSLRNKNVFGHPGIIAEIKKASPSKGVIRADFQPAVHAQDYAAHGAACLSVLTDVPYFQGHLDYLKAARSACNLPVLRKDFMVDEYQIFEARAWSADCILLIAAELSLSQLQDFEAITHSLGMAALVEVHNEAELELALQLKTPLLGINNRDLRSFEVSLQNTLKLLPMITSDRIVITESGIVTPDDVVLMQQNHVNNFLVGETFMRAESPGSCIDATFGPAYKGFVRA
ncbi:indole-3-glycerol phosphate synthase TrpC [Iodobacter sp. HSC-16F04]|uniref:Indole-3-glycerol phosphate synthase n=1 Tax=Iodobacter violaceini TaxID=3044271 RepID=A0ABX0KXT8_9NEIS|nr:indole-3-glycerol phosphate synthase TrpC [Iodobacter violacea]NHQ88644.1 indole-3-glycerol phosphate synthase TrpC [Iodobacter violacea]